MGRSRANKLPSTGYEVTFLLSQVGAHASAQFAGRLEALGLKLPHAGILRIISETDGLTQHALSDRLGVFSSRLVGLLDELERNGLVERRDNPADRRSHAIHLTDAGRAVLGQIGGIAHQTRDAVCAALSESERTLLAELLARIVAEQGLRPGVHPGMKKLGDGDSR